MSSDYSYNYFLICVLGLLAIVFALTPVLIAKLVAPKKPSKIKNDTYECGLESKGDPWVQFRVQYYLYALVFVIFDIEVVYLFPWAVVFKEMGAAGLVKMGIFVFVLMSGLVWAWGKGVLEWK